MLVPGVYADLLAWRRRFDATFCLRPTRGDCSTCRDIVALESGEPVMYTGREIWRATFDERVPDRLDQFMHDDAVYVVSRSDKLTPAAE